MNTNILVATDFSEASLQAGMLAHAIAKHDGATLGLMYVVPELWGIHERSVPSWLQSKVPHPAEIERQANEALTEWAAELQKGGVKVETFLDGGEAHVAIVRHAEEVGASLVVVGSHGRTGIRRMLLGSVAEQVVRYAHCPVLIARQGPTSGPVVTGTDLSEAARPGLREAARLAASKKAELIVLHVLDLGVLGRKPFSIDITALSTAMADTESLEKLEKAVDAEIALATEGIDVKVTREVTVGDAADSIVQRAEAASASLVVTSTHGRTGLRRALLGSVAERIVRLAHTSVLAVRD